MIEVRQLEKTFEQPGGEQVPALRGIDLVIPAGQWVTVIGTNGSGKSTLLNAIAGSFLPDAGSIHIAGVDVTRKAECDRAGLIGRVFQDPFKGTCPSMTVAENLLMAELRGSHCGQLPETLLAPMALAQTTAPVTEQEAHAIAVDAYVYFYSIMSMDISRKQFTNGMGDFKGPMNTFVNVSEYPPADSYPSQSGPPVFPAPVTRSICPVQG